MANEAMINEKCPIQMKKYGNPITEDNHHSFVIASFNYPIFIAAKSELWVGKYSLHGENSVV